MSDIQGIKLKTVVTSSNYTVTTLDDAILVDASGGTKTITLFSAASSRGKVISIKKTDTTTNAVTVVPATGQLINNASSMEISIPSFGYMDIVSNGTGWTIISSKLKNPTVQTFNSGAGIYTTPSGPSPLYIRVRMVGGGGGGTGSGTAEGTGATDGGNTTFSSLTAGGGLKSPSRLGPGSGGTASGSLGTMVFTRSGQPGGSSGTNPTTANGTQQAGGAGGNSFLGIGGYNGSAGGGAGPGSVGGGGGGGGTDNISGAYAGGGGGGGAYIETIIAQPAASYPYSVGVGGNQGLAGPGSSRNGAAGGSGLIIVEEFYP